jgi:uncharacterized protein YjbI with pentapeptide repeats
MSAHPTPISPDPKLAARWMAQGDSGQTARDEVLARLRAGESETRDLRGIRCIGESLAGVDLSGFDLRGADFSGADLTGARLVQADLRGTIMHGTNLTDAELLAADLTGANLSEVNAPRGGFGQATLEGALLFDANLEGATFHGANLTRADLRASSLRDVRMIDANLSSAMLEGAQLQGADISGCVLSDAVLDRVDLTGAQVRGVRGYEDASFIGARILGVDFCGAYLVRRFIQDQNYLHEFRNKNRMSAAVYWVWWATSDCGRSFTRWSLWTVLIMCLFGIGFQFVQMDYGDYQTPLSSFYYSVVTLTTLGYGDVLPASLPAQIMAMFEVVIGYVMLGGLLSIFANKMARRAG